MQELLGDLVKLTRWIGRPVKLGEKRSPVMAPAAESFTWRGHPAQPNREMVVGNTSVSGVDGVKARNRKLTHQIDNGAEGSVLGRKGRNFQIRVFLRVDVKID